MFAEKSMAGQATSRCTYSSLWPTSITGLRRQLA